ncbi:MAG: branched-chain amino acid ABC transporter permease [Clostridiales bacterium]|nr:branched-chain amino acid ABC transporter permease [Clostridiales bacterium]
MFLQQLLNGVSLGSIYALTAVGYSLIYSVLSLINMSHASVFLSSAILFYSFFNFGGSGMPILPAFLLTLAFAAVMGLVIERVAIRPIREKGDGMTYALISSIGVKTIIENLCQTFFGSEIKSYPTLLEGKYIEIGNARMAAIQIVIIGSAVLVLLALAWFTQRTKTGKGLRALSQNLNACYLMGIPVNRMVGVAFAVGSMLAAVAGVAFCMYYQTVAVNIGAVIGNKAFASTVLGGIGVLSGSVLGGFIIGIVEMFTAGYISSSYRNLVAFSILIFVLIVKPTGLLGKKEQTKV